MQENCKHLADEEVLSHQLFARGCVKLSNSQMVKSNMYRKIANSFELLEKCNASEYAYYHDKVGATGKKGGGGGTVH